MPLFNLQDLGDYVTKTMMDTDSSFTANSDSRIATQKAVDTSIKANRRKAYISGVLTVGVIPYMCKATTVSGVATLWLTDDGTSTGAAVFTSVPSEGVFLVAYGTGNNYQIYNVVIAADFKKITCNVNQMAGAILGLVNVTSAANGVEVRGLVLGT